MSGADALAKIGRIDQPIKAWGWDCLSLKRSSNDPGQNLHFPTIGSTVVTARPTKSLAALLSQYAGLTQNDPWSVKAA